MEAALAAWRAIGHPYGMSNALNFLGRIALALGQYAEAKSTAQDLLADLQSRLPAAVFAHAQRCGQARDIETAVAALLRAA